MNKFDLRRKIISLTDIKSRASLDNLNKELLRSLISYFGNSYYIDGNNNKVNIKCFHGEQERIVGKKKQDSTLVLPLITITEGGISNSDDRRKFNSILVNESGWDAKTKKAVRVLSLAPRAVNVRYKINIWAKYRADLDQIRSVVFGSFNPDLILETKFSQVNKAFIVSESDLGSVRVEDGSDRVLQKSIEIEVETYVPSPKFKITNTGDIANQFYVFDIDELTSEDIIVKSKPKAEKDKKKDYNLAIGLSFLNLSLTDLLWTRGNVVANLGVNELFLTAQQLQHTVIQKIFEADLGFNNLNLSLEDISSLFGANLGIVELATTAENLSYHITDNIRSNLGVIDLTLSQEDLVFSRTENYFVNLGVNNLLLSEFISTVASNIVERDLGVTFLSLTTEDFESVYTNNTYTDLGVLDLVLGVEDFQTQVQEFIQGNLGIESISLTLGSLAVELGIAFVNNNVNLSESVITRLVYNNDVGVNNVLLSVAPGTSIDIGVNFLPRELLTPDPDL